MKRLHKMLLVAFGVAFAGIQAQPHAQAQDTDLPKDRPTAAGHDIEGDDECGSAPLPKTKPRLDIAPSEREAEAERMAQVKLIQKQSQDLRAAQVAAGHPPHPLMGKGTRPFVWADGQTYNPVSDRNRMPLPVRR
jgi:hypothetical protein